MAVEKIGIYRKWLGAVPTDKSGNPIPRSQWPRKRRYHWIVRWYGTAGKRYGKVFETRKEADRYAIELQKQAALGRIDRPRNITLCEFYQEHKRIMKGQVADATLDDQLRALRILMEFLGSSRMLRSIQPAHAEALIAHRLASGSAVGTANKDIRTLRRVFNLAIEPRGYLLEGQNAFAKLKQRRMAQSPNRYVSVGEYRRLADMAPNGWWRAVLAIAYGSGLRRNEILHLTWADIDFENQQIRIASKRAGAQTIAWEPKDHEKRFVPMSEKAAQLLARMQIEGEDNHPYVFISPRRLARIKRRQSEGRWSSRSEVINNMWVRLDRMVLKASLSKLSLHDLRRSAITNWAQRLPIQVVQQLAGHSDITTTREYYITVRPEDMAVANSVVNEIVAER